ncbi:MAG: hypothetical protein MJZ25_08750 [Fibrobacter sp.]|nr:hypothetical protein [Fibrobacter sp.]
MQDNLKFFTVITIALTIVVCTIVGALKYTEKEISNQKLELSRASDSLATYYSERETMYEQKISDLTLQAQVATSQRDSLKEYAISATKTSKQLIRTVYKDSIKEIYVENTEAYSTYEKTISTLRDSILDLQARKVETDVQYVERIVHDTIVQVSHTTDSVFVNEDKVVKKDNQSKWGVYADGHIGYGTGGFQSGAMAGAKYFIAGPIYARAGIKYDGDITGELGAGLDIRF